MTPDPFKSLQYHLDKQGQDTLYKLAQWAKVLGYINVTLGGFNGIIAIPLLFGGHRMAALSVPSIFMSGILIYMGLQLTGAAANLRFAGLNENDKGFSDALVKIQNFFFPVCNSLSNWLYPGPIDAGPRPDGQRRIPRADAPGSGYCFYLIS